MQVLIHPLELFTGVDVDFDGYAQIAPATTFANIRAVQWHLPELPRNDVAHSIREGPGLPSENLERVEAREFLQAFPVSHVTPPPRRMPARGETGARVPGERQVDHNNPRS